MSVSLTGSKGSKVVADLRPSSLSDIFGSTNPLLPRRIDLKKKAIQISLEIPFQFVFFQIQLKSHHFAKIAEKFDFEEKKK